MFCLNKKIHFSLANANNSASFKRKRLKITSFAHSQTTNKLVKTAANDSTRVSRQDRKKPPALGTNQIAGFGGFRPLASLEKIKSDISLVSKFLTTLRHPNHFVLAGANNRNVIITYRFLAAPVQANRDFFYIDCMTVYVNCKYFP